jgi:hypothetical protein
MYYISELHASCIVQVYCAQRNEDATVYDPENMVVGFERVFHFLTYYKEHWRELSTGKPPEKLVSLPKAAPHCQKATMSYDS